MRPENYQAIHQPPSNEFELNFGPNHPGIEGNYALKVKLHGDTVISAKADGGYLHRGFEKLMEQRLWIQNISLVPRICVPDPSPMEVVYSMAVETLCGLEVPERAQWLRVMQLELSRLTAHLFTFGGHAATTGMYTTMYWGVTDRDLILDLSRSLPAAGFTASTTSRGASGGNCLKVFCKDSPKPWTIWNRAFQTMTIYFLPTRFLSSAPRAPGS